ncbi:alpha/beta hydrolase [Rhodococcus sp. DMU1]|uniref:alpha/beta fold hydrolase n=1 Tax=Rhodococcus sp. DMU1 TaxID=2722825 RepID=UPI00143ECD77|nr:alpha/beta hydrolase [Rhodococcus sp. DMU1]QIX54066.1 alpha/beta hydrolase [Rhodococcus sp. DMU1]
MVNRLSLAPCPVTDWSDERRRARLRTTRWGHHWGRFGRLRRALVSLVLALAAISALYGQYWLHDVAPERARLAHTRPYLHSIFDAADPADHATAVVDLVGLGNLDATDTARALPALAELGQVWAVQYDNAGIDTAVISRMIIDHAEQAGVERIVLAGHSMGGILALEVAEHVVTDSDLNLLAVFLDCTPIDLHAVRADERDTGEDLLRWMGWVPGARESRTLRLVVETAARNDRYLVAHRNGLSTVDPGALAEAVTEVLRDKIFSTDAASNGLIEAQFQAIVASGALDDLRALAVRRGARPRPAVVFLRPRYGTDDEVVDVDYTQKVLFDRVGGPQGSLRVVRLDGTGHANPIQQPQAYNAAVQAKVVPFVDRLTAQDLRPVSAGGR